ncbi:MAG: hypothetical protein ACQESB_06360, partial [Elusimicrobiota bacterium]
EWDYSTKSYIYPEERTAEDYPAFKWAEELEWKGYDDWRLPTGQDSDPAHQIGPANGGELLHLYDNRVEAGLSYAEEVHWSSTESSSSQAHRVYLGGDGSVGSAMKAYSRRVHAVRSIQ